MAASFCDLLLVVLEGLKLRREVSPEYRPFNEIVVSKNEIRVSEISVILFLFISFISPQISQQTLPCVSAVYSDYRDKLGLARII